VAMAGLRRRPRPTTNSCLSEEAFGTGQNGGANNEHGNPCRVFQGRRSSFFSSALPQAASGPGGAGSRSLGAWRERRGRAGAALRLDQYGDQPAKFKTSTRVFPLFRAFKDGSQGIVPRASWSACP
jgi:hypothetical protein